MTVRARSPMSAPPPSTRHAVLLALLLTGGAAHAALPDPTRPPAGLGSASPGTNPMPRLAYPAPIDASSASPRPARPAPPAAPVIVPRVQALHYPSGASLGSATALIDGRLVRVGDRLGETTVQDIRPDGVWLRLPRGGTQWLGLYALVELPAAESVTAAAPPPEQNTPRKEP